jgi:hypothetical protein
MLAVCTKRISGCSKAVIEGGRNSLLSMRYGRPKTISMLTPAMRIMGFLSNDKGETENSYLVSVRLSLRCPTENDHKTKQSKIKQGGKLTACSLHTIVLCGLCSRLHHIPPTNDHHLAFVVPCTTPKCTPGRNGLIVRNVYAQRRKGMCRTLDGEEVATRRDVPEGKGVRAVERCGVVF